MEIDFRKLLNPTDDELKELYDRVNEMLKAQYEKYGECCATCKHCKYMQVSVYSDYRMCRIHNAVRFAQGDGSTKYKCKDYEFVGYLEVKENN